MGSVFLRGKTWVGDFQYNGRIHRKSLGKKGVVTKTQAREMLRIIERNNKLGQYGMLDAEIPTLSEFREPYIAFQRDTKRIRSHERSEYAIKHFVRFYGDKKLNEITPEDIDIYKQRRLSEGVKLGTVKRELNVIRNLFNQAKKWKKFFNDNPVSLSGMPEVHDEIERVLTVNEEKRLLEAIPEGFKPIILIALNTGMRLGEILGLRWEWIDLEEGIINLPQTHTKGKRSRKVPVNPIVRRILLENRLKSGGNEFVFPRQSYYSLLGKLRRAFKEACMKANIVDLRFHDLRHTVGTRLGEEGIPIQTISRLLGHTSTRMTERYVHPEESVKKATDLLAHFSNSVTDKSTDIKVEG